MQLSGFDGRAAFVTGAAGGIGLALVAQLRAAGARVTATDTGEAIDQARAAGRVIEDAQTQWRALDLRDGAAVTACVAAARAAFPAWSSLPAAERAAWMEKLAAGIEARLDEFARAESRDVGKPLALARSLDIPRAVSNLRFFAHAATQFASESHHGEAGLNYTLRAPLGVVAAISPWNLPLYLFTWKIAPALAAGNTVVAKPSEVTPVTAWNTRCTWKRLIWASWASSCRLGGVSAAALANLVAEQGAGHTANRQSPVIARSRHGLLLGHPLAGALVARHGDVLVPRFDVAHAGSVVEGLGLDARRQQRGQTKNGSTFHGKLLG